MTSSVRLLCIAVAAGMFAFMIYCFANAWGLDPIVASMAPLWGKFVWADVSVGFLLMATIVFTYERSTGFSILMLVLMFALGNLAVALWLLWRGPDLYRRIAEPAA
jgi:hypothetical protein